MEAVNKTKSISSKRKPPKVGHYAEDLKAELRRVTWPTRSTVVSASVVILFVVVMSTLYVTGVDLVFSKLAYWLGIYK